MNAARQIGILYTGGTIGMVPGTEGLTPSTHLAALAAPYLPSDVLVQWHVCDPLIDSSALTLGNWRDWLAWIKDNLPRYDGLLILHGTDTLAYTANLLALALPGLDKPVIVTGAQWPLGQTGSDAPLNLQTALAAVSLPDYRHVGIAFNGTLWRAVGSSKVSTELAAGFATPHFAPLGQWSPTAGWTQLRLSELPPPARVNTLRLRTNVRIISFVLTPGANADMVADAIAQQRADGIVLQSYGHGNAPQHTRLLTAIRAATAHGTPVLNISQAAQGCTAAVYAQGQALRDAGIINGGKCNLETAIALLTLAASNGWSTAQIQNCLEYWQLTV